jgi:outer membrane protein TolC
MMGSSRLFFRLRIVRWALAAAAALLLLPACAALRSATKGTADSPAHVWTPPSREAELPLPVPSPVIPPDLLVPNRPWTLSDVVDVGLSNNPRTRAAWNSARAASAAVGLSLGAYLPRIDLSLPGSKQKAAFAGGRFIVEQTTLTPTAGLNLLLFDFGGREADVKASRRVLEAANWTQNAVYQAVILDIETAYYQYLSAKALLDAQQTSFKGAQVNYEAANARHQAGVATIADVLQAKTSLSTIELEVVTAEGLIQTLHGALASAMGLPADAGFEVSDTLPESIPFDCVDRQVELCIKDAEAARPDLAASRATALAAEAGVQKARSTFFPTLSLSGNIGRIYYRGNAVSNPFYSISVSVDLPFLFGLQHYAVQAAKAEAAAAQDQVTELGRGVELQVWTSYYGLKTAAQKIKTAGDLLASAQASYDVALGRYKEGVGSILDLLSAQTTLVNARVQLVQSRTDWYLALVQFMHDTGKLAPPARPVPQPVPPKGDQRP